MKKILLFASALAGLFLAGSCQRENLEPVQQGGTVTYTVQVPGALATKAAGDYELIYEVYRKAQVGTDAAPIYEGKKTFSGNSVDLPLEFVKNQNFVVLFWAQKEGVTAYNTDDLRNVTLNSDLTANQENYEVFAGMDEVSNCVSSNNGNVELVRPIAQLNIATDAEGLKLGDTDVTLISSFVTVKGLSTTYNVYNKAVSETLSDVEFSVAAVPDGKLGTTDYTYVAMNYIGFIDANGTTVNVDFTVKTSEGDIAHSVSSVPVKPNYKTNIIGNLITATDNYNVTLGAWGTPETNVEVVAVSTAQDLQEAIENISTGSEGNIILEGNIDLGALAGLVSTKADAPAYGLLIPAGKALVLDLNGCTISQTVNQTGNYSMIQNDGNLTILDSKDNGKIAYIDSGNGGEYISNTITNRGTLTVKSGNVENNSSEAMANVGYAYAIDSSIWGEAAETVTNIEGGTVKSTYSPLRVRADSQTENVIANISGGHIYGRIDHQMSSSKAGVKGTLNISGGTFTPYGIKNTVIKVFGAGQNTDASGIVLNISGGIFNASIEVNKVDPVALGQGFNEKFITGGTFTVDPSGYVANGYVAKQNENNLWTIVPAPAVVEGGYEISNAAQLKYFAESVNAGETTYNGTTIKLAADIDLQNEPWTPIGFNDQQYYTGTFDGGNHTIRNLNIVETEAKEGKAYIGLFGYAKNATIKNLNFENVNLNIACLDIDHSQGHIGAVAGSLEETSTIENVTVKGDIKVEATQDANGASRVAVVAGGNSYGNVTMKNVHVIANEGSYLIANNNTGALAGQLQGKSVFENCSSNIDVTVNKFFAGGIIGLAAGDQTFTNCQTTGNISVVAGREGKAHDHYRVGGIAGGWADGAKNVCTLTGCSYTGKLTGKNSDGSVADAFDYAGYVGRGYTLNGCAGSKVVIDGVEYVQVYNTAADAGIYYVNGDYTVASAANLKLVADKVNAGVDYFEGTTIKLGADIDLNNQEWNPIGSAAKDHGFMGNFDGNGYAIKNLKMTTLPLDADNYVYAGLFGVTEGTDANNQNYIKNLVIENVTIATEGHIAAAAIAYPYYTVVENLTVKGDINIKGGNYTSGALAYTRRCINAKNITVEGNEGSSIEGNNTVGGVISDIQMNGGLTANYSNFKASGLTITAAKSVGGISGIISGQTLDGATVEDLVIACDDSNHKGSVSGSLGAISFIKNISVKNVQGADSVVGAPYDGTGKVAVNGDEYSVTVE